MQRVFYDMVGRDFLPPQGVTLATLGVPPYSPPSEDWDGEDPASLGAEASGPADVSPFAAMPWAAPETGAPGAGISFVDMVRAISPVAQPEAWREDNRAPFWLPDDARAQSGPSSDDYVRIIDPRVNPDIWREHSASQYAGWDNLDSYPVPHDPRAAALGAFRIPSLPDDATGWGLRERSQAGVDDIVPVLLASRWGRDILAKVWKAIGGVPGGRRPDGPPASAPTGRKGYPLGSHNPPSRNPPGKLNDQPSSGHAFDKMQDEGLMPSVVDQARRQGNPKPGKLPGTTRYYDKINDVSVVVDDKTGGVITTYYGDK